MSILEFLYYIWIFFAIWYNIWIINKDHWLFQEQVIYNIRYKDMNRSITSSKEAIFLLLQILYSIWGFFGLFTSNGLFFMITLIISMSHQIPIFKHNYWCNVLDGILCIIIYTFIFLNKTMFHINIYKYILDHI